MGLERIGERLERPTSLSKGNSLLGRPRSCILTDPRCDVVESLLSLHNLGKRRRISSCKLEDLGPNDPYGRLLQNAGFWNAKVSDFGPLLVVDGR